MIKRWMVLCSLFVLVGCGSSNPVNNTTSPGETDTPSAPTTLMVLPVADLLVYLREIDPMFQGGGPIQVMNQEYAGVTSDVTLDLVPRYWARQFTRNLLARIENLQATLQSMRPENPVIRQIHIEELEGAFVDYHDGVSFFDQNIDNLSADDVDELNLRMGSGNVHLIRLEILLSDLAGGSVNLGSEGGQGEGPFEVNQVSGTSFEGGLGF
jgi:hypothetical protein